MPEPLRGLDIWSDRMRDLIDDIAKGPVRSWSPMVCTYASAAEFVEETYEIADFVAKPKMTIGEVPVNFPLDGSGFRTCGRQNRQDC